MRTLLLSCSVLSLLGLTLSTGCIIVGGTGGTGASSSQSSSSAGGGAPSSDITGTARSTWLTDTGEQADLPESNFTISAIYQKADMSFAEITGSYDPASGNFTIKGVPPGPYYLRTDAASYYVMTERTRLDLGAVYGGRPDAVYATKSPTDLTLNLTNLTAWQGNDTMELFSLGGDTWDDIVINATVPPVSGATTLSAYDVDLSQLSDPGLIDGSKGDTAMVTHLTSRMAGSTAYQALGQVLSLPSITMVDGQPTVSGGAFSAVPQTNVSLNWTRSAFAALVASAGPGATATSYDAYVYIEPGGKTRTSTAPAVSLLNLSELDGTDITFSLDYGNPFPAAWGAIAMVDVAYSVHENTPGVIKHLDGFISVTAPADTLLQGSPVTPLISPPTGVTIGGQPATSDLTGVGLTPTIAWKAPAMGTPTFYTVRIKSFGATNETVAVLHTTDTSLPVPSGLLQQSVSYAAIVRASNGAHDPKALYRSDPTEAHADALTALFSP